MLQSKMINIKRNDHILNVKIYTMTNTKSRLQQVRSQQLKFLEHIFPLLDGELPKTCAYYVTVHGRRRPNHQRSFYLLWAWVAQWMWH